MCPVTLLDSYLVHRKNLNHSGDHDLLFPQVGVKYEPVKPTYFDAIQTPMVPITYDNYRNRLKKHLDCETLRELGVFPLDYSTHSFRKGSLSMLADGEIHPAFIQKSTRHKCWESSSLYIDVSLPKALKANELLSGNDPSEGWGSQYSGNPRSLSLFLPEKSIKKMPQKAEDSLKGGDSVSLTTSSHCASSLLQEETLLKKRPNISNQEKFCDKRVKFVENKTLTATSASSAPDYSIPNLHLAA